jgi:hypothetical protein
MKGWGLAYWSFVWRRVEGELERVEGLKSGFCWSRSKVPGECVCAFATGIQLERMVYEGTHSHNQACCTLPLHLLGLSCL